MRSRWFHAPSLHGAHVDHKAAGWLELFYDLIFVAAFIQLGNGLSSKLSVESVISFASAFTALWISWSGFTYFMNRFTVDDFVHRLMVFAQMFTVALMAFFAGELLAGRHQGFALAYATSQVLVASFNFRSWLQVQEGKPFTSYWGRVFALAGLLWLVAAFLPQPWAFIPMGLGAALIFLGPLSNRHESFSISNPIDEHHLAERLGLLTLIVLGESFVKVLDAASTSSEGLGLLGRAAFLLVLTISLWWVYFDDVAGSKLRPGRLNQLIWWIGHLPLQMAITATGVAIKKASSLDLGAVAKEEYRWLLCGSLAVVLASVALIDSVTERRQAELSDRARVGMRAFSAVTVVLLALAGGRMMASTFLILVTASLVAQVAFDMMMAPLEDTPKAALDAQPLADRVNQPHQERQSQPTDLRTTVRRNTPSDLRHDLYFYFMDGGWTRLLVAFGFSYVMLNVLFACVYAFRPGSVLVPGGDEASFAEAFAFSVQTMSTIGYGVMSPGSQFGDTVVAIEAAVGLFGVALATGLVFAKVSRPEARILFSEKLVVAQRNGVPHLMFRAGNVRGNDLVEASVSVVAILDEFTAEGEHMRELVQLSLVRDRSPMFSLTWTVMHEINEESPFRCLVDSGVEDHLVAIAATLVGHDGTYGQTVYSRKVWNPDEVLVGHRHADILSQLPDGRLMVDYSSFQDTVEDFDPRAAHGVVDSESAT